MPVLEYTLFRDLPRFEYCDRVESVRLGAQAYVAAGTTSLYEGHGLTPTVIRAYRENAERDTLPLRMHAPVSMPSAAFDDQRWSISSTTTPGRPAGAAAATISCAWKASTSAAMPMPRSPTSSRRATRTINGPDTSTRR